MTDKSKVFVYPKDVSAFGFDWGKLALTVAPEVNGATRFSGGVVDLPSGKGHTRHN
ncbi:cupin, partial [Mesorhizobium sp. M7A.F.Ca.CA.002.09.1.1]